MNRVFINVLLVLIAVYAAIWAFNHINAWVGIGIVVVLIYLLIRFIKKLV